MNNGIPVLSAQGDCLARAWESSLLALHRDGCDLATQYDAPGDPPSRDSTMVVTVLNPDMEPMIHLDMPGGFEDLQEYEMEVLEGIKDHLVRDPDDPDDTRWEYTYHQRLFAYDVPGLPSGPDGPYDQIEKVCQDVAACPYTRRAQAITWKVWEDSSVDDPACLQSVWCRIIPTTTMPWRLNMNVRFRSRDAYKAAFMNMFVLIRLQKLMAERIQDLMGMPVTLGRYCDFSDSYHIYGKDRKEFEGRFLNAIKTRPFERRAVRYCDWKDQMEGARPRIMEKVAKMARPGDKRAESNP